MSGDKRNLDRMIDQALDEIRELELPSAEETTISRRVWLDVSREERHLGGQAPEQHSIRDCSDFQALIPAYLRGGLTEAKSLLLEDHVGECVPCRRALKQARAERRSERTSAADSRGRGRFSTIVWRVAVAAAVFIALIGLSVKTDLFSIEAGGLIHIESLEGQVYSVTGQTATPLSTGDEISFKDVRGIRTGRGGHAMLRLEDGSQVEMNERAELSVRDRRKLWERGRGDAVIDLARGNIIVEASDQGSGHLYVDTDDCGVAVTGTVFAVNTGIKGSRVSVLEGEVHVAHDGATDVLEPGSQLTTRDDLSPVPIRDEIAWSRNLEKHLALLHELARVTNEIDRQLEGPGLRYSTDLLDRAPAGTLIYIGIPNISDFVTQAYDLMRQRIASNDLLNDWWSESMAGSEAEARLQETMDKIRSFGGQIGDEVLVALARAGGDDSLEPVVLTRLEDPDAFRSMLENELTELDPDAGTSVCVFQGDLTGLSSCAAGAEVYFWIRGDRLVAGSQRGLRHYATSVPDGLPGPFAATAFHAQIANLYRDGVEWVVAVDLEHLIPHDGDAETAKLERLGLLDLQHAIAEHKELGGRSQNRAVLTFTQARRGLTAWLAEPAPMGSLDFISSEAYVAGGFVMKEPAAVVDELFSFVADEDPEFEHSLAEFEREHSIDVRDDIAATLGGEFAFALDGPVLPKPSWKLVVEVYDPARLQATLEWATGQLSDLLVGEDRQGFRMTREESGGRTFYALESLDTGISARYMFEDGYMVVAASKALLERSLQHRAAGTTLQRSPRFLALMPQDDHVNFSGVFYQNLGPVIAPLSRLGEGAAQVSPEAEGLLEGLGSLQQPSLTLIYGDPDRIQLVNTREGGILTSSLGRFLSLDGLLSVQQLVGQAVEEQETSN